MGTVEKSVDLRTMHVDLQVVATIIIPLSGISMLADSDTFLKDIEQR